MKVILISQWYPPEHTPIGHMFQELADELVSRGHQATVITGFPNHPSGNIFPGYKKTLHLKEIINGVDVNRLYLYTSPNRGKVSRILTFITFTFTSAWALLKFRKHDLVFAVSQPLSV